MTTVRMLLSSPWNCTAGLSPTAIGQKLSCTVSQPAVSVVVASQTIGTSVTQA